MSFPTMTWPTVAQVKSILRIQTAAEDDVVALILAQAKATVLGYIDRAVDATEMTMEDTANSEETWPIVTKLYCADWPMATDPAPVLTDVDGTVVDATTYDVLARLGIIRAKAGTTFNNGPYTIDATVGLTTLGTDFTNRYEALLFAAVTDLCAVWYEQRNANTIQESEAGVSRTYGRDDIPPRIKTTLSQLRRPSRQLGTRLT